MGVTPEFWAGKRVFVTGHRGFKGAWLSLWLSNLHAVVVGYALRPSTDANLFVAARVGECLEALEGDILDFQRIRTALREAAPQIVLHLAAQALVRPSYPCGFSLNAVILRRAFPCRPWGHRLPQMRDWQRSCAASFWGLPPRAMRRSVTRF